MKDTPAHVHCDPKHLSTEPALEAPKSRHTTQARAASFPTHGPAPAREPSLRERWLARWLGVLPLCAAGLLTASADVPAPQETGSPATASAPLPMHRFSGAFLKIFGDPPAWPWGDAGKSLGEGVLLVDEALARNALEAWKKTEGVLTLDIPMIAAFAGESRSGKRGAEFRHPPGWTVDPKTLSWVAKPWEARNLGGELTVEAAPAEGGLQVKARALVDWLVDYQPYSDEELAAMVRDSGVEAELKTVVANSAEQPKRPRFGERVRAVETLVEAGRALVLTLPAPDPELPADGPAANLIVFVFVAAGPIE